MRTRIILFVLAILALLFAVSCSTQEVKPSMPINQPESKMTVIQPQVKQQSDGSEQGVIGNAEEGATFTGIFKIRLGSAGNIVKEISEMTGIDISEHVSTFNLTQTGKSISGTYTIEESSCPSSQLSVTITGEIDSNNVAVLYRPSSKVICSPQVSISLDKGIYDVSLTEEGNLKVTQRGTSYKEIFIRQR